MKTAKFFKNGFVAQVSNLLYRRFPIGRASKRKVRPVMRGSQVGNLRHPDRSGEACATIFQAAPFQNVCRVAAIICVVFLPGICNAGPANASEGSATSSAGGAGQMPQPAAVSPQPSGTSQINSTVAKSPSANLPAGVQLSSIPSGKAAKPVPNSLHSPATQHSTIQPAGPLLGKAPDHGHAPAIVGGPAATKTKTTAAVTGTGLNRKP